MTKLFAAWFLSVTLMAISGKGFAVNEEAESLASNSYIAIELFWIGNEWIGLADCWYFDENGTVFSFLIGGTFGKWSQSDSLWSLNFLGGKVQGRIFRSGLYGRGDTLVPIPADPLVVFGISVPGGCGSVAAGLNNGRENDMPNLGER